MRRIWCFLFHAAHRDFSVREYEMRIYCEKCKKDYRP